MKPESPTKILIVEDEPTLRDLLAHHLRLQGYEVVVAADGEAGLAAARAQLPDLCIFDVMLPLLDGVSMCRILRKESDTPIILLTARGAEMDRVSGLESGADDYVVKPFGMAELSARVRTALRRTQRPITNALHIRDVRLDLVARRAYVGEAELRLSLKEFDLLATLMRNKGAVLTRDFLLAQVWGHDYEGDPRTLDVHIRWLREKIEPDPSKPLTLQTVRGIGYRVG